MDLLERINSLTDDQLQMVAERDDASGVLASYRLAELRGLPYPDRSVVVLADDYAIVASNGKIERVEIDGGVSKIIREEAGQFCVYSEDGERSFGCYDTMYEAEERLRQIHYFEQAKKISVGDHVLFAVPKPPASISYAHGQVDRIERTGTVTLPGTNQSEEATSEDPVAVVTVWAETEGGYVETDRKVVRRFSELRTSNESLTKEVSAKVMETLREKAREHNEEVGDAKTKRTSARTLAAVFERGVGAYRTSPGSVRPNVTSAEQWAYGRVNGFLHALKTGRFKRTPFDTDLLPKGHRYSTKAAGISEGSFVEWGENNQGRVEYVMTEGVFGIPESDFSIAAEPDDPAVLIRLWEKTDGEWEEQETLVGQKMSSLREIMDLEAVTKETFKPPKGVQEAGQRALDWIAEGHAGSGFTDVGRARAAQLARGDNVSEETIRRMHSYLARHEGDSAAEGFNAGEEGFPSPGRVAWDAWGGDAGKTWAGSIVERLEPKQACPLATHDIVVNLKNRQTAIDVADYGPMNPALPNDEYWEHLSEYFDTTPEEARESVCGNCAAFDQTEHILDCIADGIDGDTEDPYDVIDAGDLGYCRIFKFKCAAARTCSAWITGGPLTDEEPKELEKARFLRKADEARFTLGPLYVPDFMDAHGEWTDANELQPAVWGWVRSGDRRIFLQHDTEVEAGEWVEVMTMPQAWTVDMLDNKGNPIGEVTYPPNTVFLGVIWNEESWQLVKQGKLRGYSIGGFSDRMLADLPMNGERDGIELEAPPQDLAKAIAVAVAEAMRHTQPTVNVVMPEQKSKVRRIERDDHGNISRIIEEDE